MHPLHMQVVNIFLNLHFYLKQL